MNSSTDNREFDYKGWITNGFLMLFCQIILIPLAVFCIFYFTRDPEQAWVVLSTVVLVLLFFFVTLGYFVQQPNQSRVMIFFGTYRGTFRHTGFFWRNPFMTAKKISLRIRNMDVAPIKVNDKVGNPVMIGMVLVWKVKDTYRAVFDIDSGDTSAFSIEASGKTTVTSASAGTARALENFVSIQSDAALREVTGQFAYDEDRKSVV